MAFRCCPHHQCGQRRGRSHRVHQCSAAARSCRPGSWLCSRCSQRSHSAPGDLLVLFPHHLFLALCASHITKSIASAANLWSSVICFSEFLPKVTICSTTVQYLPLHIFTHGSSLQLVNDINGLHRDLAQEEKLQKSLHSFSSRSVPGL